MKILCWNVFHENRKHPDDIAHFVFSHGADVICLQEVAPLVLGALESRVGKEFSCSVAHGMRHEDGELSFLVILSRIPRLRHRTIAGERGKRWRSFFSSFWHRVEEHLESQYVDVLSSGSRIRIFNVHLEVGTGPRNRLRQFRCVMRYRSGFDIVAGDLNIYGETWYQRFIGWVWFGLEVRELLLDERDEFERQFNKLALRNIFKGRNTFSAISGVADFQFDHILIPTESRVLYSAVVDDQCGSDHKAIIADVDI